MRHPLLALTCATLIVGAFSPALAQTNSSGIALRWDTCYGEGGLDNKLFACNTNSGSAKLVATYRLDHALSQVTGSEVFIDIKSASSSLPSWWDLFTSGSCRFTSLHANGIGDPAWTACVDHYQGTASAQVARYDRPGLNWGRAYAVCAVPAADSFLVDAGTENFAMNVVIDYAKTVGTGSCAGCDIPACLDLEQIKVYSPTVYAGELILENGAPYTSSKLCVWQSGTFATYSHNVCDPLFGNCIQYITDTFTCAGALDPTPARASTWGLIKTLYR